MANIYEITRNLIEFRGEVKAATITANNNIVAPLKIGYDKEKLELWLWFLNDDFASLTGIIWFQPGSYAYLDKDGAGYYWNYVQVPEIPKDLC